MKLTNQRLKFLRRIVSGAETAEEMRKVMAILLNQLDECAKQIQARKESKQ